jgi:outer membrane immunogenic protein
MNIGPGDPVMKKLFLATTALVVLAATSAGAADMTARPAYGAPPVPVYTWTGLYWGGNVGYSWGTAKDDATESTTVLGGTNVTTTSQSQNINGVIGGVQAGYNYQFGTWVWGWETDFQASGQKGGSTFNGVVGGAVAVPFTVATDHKIDWFGTTRGRLGVLWGPNVLVYGTAGVAYGQVKDSATLNGSLAAAAVTASAVSTFNDVKAGWTAGAGVEAALGGGWSAKLEYLYIDLGKTELTNAAVGTVGGAVALAISDRRTFRDTDNIVRAGLNYKWGGGGYGY